MASVEFVNVTKRFGKVEAVRDLSLSIADGEFMTPETVELELAGTQLEAESSDASVPFDVIDIDDASKTLVLATSEGIRQTSRLLTSAPAS